jgi:hypothetical protein
MLTGKWKENNPWHWRGWQDTVIRVTAFVHLRTKLALKCFTQCCCTTCHDPILRFFGGGPDDAANLVEIEC